MSDARAISRSSVTGRFIAGPAGPIFVLMRLPPHARYGVMVVPPFAEEMNKCRRMLTELSLRLAHQGIATVIPDLFGTGDSAGDFADADWSVWQGDIRCVNEWCRDGGLKISGLVAVRLGAALAVADGSADGNATIERTVLWQPVFDGPRFVTQFLRLRVAARMASQQGRESVTDLRGRLANGETLDVAGYRLSGGLVRGIDTATLPSMLPPRLGTVRWMEVVREEGAAPGANVNRVIDSTRAAGGEVEFVSFGGEPFWASTEIVSNEDMVRATAAFFAEPEAAPGDP